MPSLTEHQKQLLRSIRPGLGGETVKNEWRVLRSGRGIIGIYGLDEQIWRSEWMGKVTEADINQFVRCGLMSVANYSDGLPYMLLLDEEAIRQAVDSNFVAPNSSTANYYITGNGVINVNSTLQNTIQIVDRSPSISEETRQHLAQLINQLREDLEMVPAEQASPVADQAQVLAQTLDTDSPDTDQVAVTSEGLAKAAATVATITPAVMSTVGNILQLLRAAGLLI